MTADTVIAMGLGLGLHLLWGLLAGLLVGLAHFGGLWATLRALPALGRPRLAFWASWLARNALALAGFRLALALGPAALTASVAGFLAARTWLVRRLALGEDRSWN